MARTDLDSYVSPKFRGQFFLSLDIFPAPAVADVIHLEERGRVQLRDEKVAQLLVRRDDSAETEKIILCYIRRTSQSFKKLP